MSLLPIPPTRTADTPSPSPAIVIPAVQIAPHFTTLGEGLLHASHARESPATLHALLLATTPPLLDNKAKPKSWWRAQCLLYGLDAPEKRTVQELRAALELALLKRELEVPAALALVESRERGKFRKLNAQVRDATAVVVKKQEKEKDPPPKKKAPLKPPAKKPPPKDPLMVVRDAGKVAKSQPAKKKKKNEAVTVNLTINMPSAAAQKPARAKTAAAKPKPKPRAEKKPKPAASDPAYFTSAAAPEEPKPQPKPRTKQTARCSARGGLGKSAPRARVAAPDWAGKHEDEDVKYHAEHYW